MLSRLVQSGIGQEQPDTLSLTIWLSDQVQVAGP
jgi:hypothetical protein